MFRRRLLIALAAIATTLVFVATDADARAGRGFSGGSRGTRTFSAPPSTTTAPNTAAPIQRTQTQPTSAGTVGQGAPRPGLFGGGLLGGLAAGFIGAGLFGLLFGHGLFGGLGGLASVLGLIIQIALVAIVARLIWTWWQRRQGLATASGPALRNIVGDSSAYRAAGASAPQSGGFAGKVAIGKSDYDDFERLLNEVSLAYGEEDAARLRILATPEMQGYFSEQLASNVSRGVINKISGIRLLQGDLAEAWREGDEEYASVAMRYEIVDQTVDRATGRVVEGADTPQEVTEIWTFLRTRGGGWMLSAIQQTK